MPRLSSAATRLAGNSEYETVPAVKALRDRSDTTIEAMTADGQFTSACHMAAL